MSRRIRLDPHVHTVASYDSRAPVKQVLAAAREADLDAVASTDHDTMRGARRALEQQSREGPVVIPGVEISSADGQVLALGVADRPEPGRPFDAPVEAIRERGGVAVVPHPFQRSRHGVGRSSLHKCDGIEIYNAMAMTGLQNRRSRLFAGREGYPMLGGSDAHRPVSVGRAYTEVTLPSDTEPVTADLIVAGIRAGRTTVVGRREPIRRYLGKVLHNARLHTLERLRLRGRPKQG